MSVRRDLTKAEEVMRDLLFRELETLTSKRTISDYNRIAGRLSEALSAANLTIEADWNTDMEAAPAKMPLEFLHVRSGVKIIMIGQVSFNINLRRYFEVSRDHSGFYDPVISKLKLEDFTAWKPLNPPGER